MASKSLARRCRRWSRRTQYRSGTNSTESFVRNGGIQWDEKSDWRRNLGGWTDGNIAKIGEEEKRDAIDNLLQKSSEKNEKNSEQRSKDEEKRLEDDTKAAVKLFEKIPEKKKEEILRAMENFIAFDETEASKKSWEKKSRAVRRRRE